LNTRGVTGTPGVAKGERAKVNYTKAHWKKSNSLGACGKEWSRPVVQTGGGVLLLYIRGKKSAGGAAHHKKADREFAS